MRNQFLCILLLMLCTTANAQYVRNQDDRAGRFDVSLMWKFQSAENVDRRGGTSLDFSSNNNVGFTFGYNFTNNLNLQWELSFLNPNYRATFVDDNGEMQTINTRSNFTSSQFNFTYHILDGPITPFLMAGLGWTLVDSNIRKPNTTTCYWDPWYGYVCFSQTYKENDFTYNVGLGLRWDFAERFFTRGSYGVQWVDFGNGGGPVNFRVGRFEIGVKF